MKIPYHINTLMQVLYVQILLFYFFAVSFFFREVGVGGGGRSVRWTKNSKNRRRGPQEKKFGNHCPMLFHQSMSITQQLLPIYNIVHDKITLYLVRTVGCHKTTTCHKGERIEAKILKKKTVLTS